MNKLFVYAVPMLFMLLASGCVTLSELDEEDHAAIAQRVEARWVAINAGDFEGAWSYSTPSFREVFPKHLYRMNFSQTVLNRLTAVEVTSYDARAAVASVAVRVMAEPTKYSSAAAKAVGAIPDTIEESWVFVDGEWWYIDRTRRM
jgi:hypothetical protein